MEVHTPYIFDAMTPYIERQSIEEARKGLFSYITAEQYQAIKPELGKLLRGTHNPDQYGYALDIINSQTEFPNKGDNEAFQALFWYAGTILHKWKGERNSLAHADLRRIVLSVMLIMVAIRHGAGMGPLAAPP